MEKATIEEIRSVLKYLSKGYKVPDIVYQTIFEAAKREIEGKRRVVLYKRDPNINATRIQAAYVKVIEGNSIDIHPGIVGGFGADFDGDTMAIYAPLSEESQLEAKNKMVTVVDAMTINSPNFKFEKEMLVGLFTLTYTDKGGTYKKVNSIDEIKKMHIGQRVEINYKGEKRNTTAGRIIFNEALPIKYPFIDDAINKKKIQQIMKSIINVNKLSYAETFDNLMKLSFYYATIYPKTISLDQMDIPKSILELKKKLSVETDLTRQMDIVTKMEEELTEYLKKNDSDLYYMVASGGAKGTNQLRQVMVAKGLIADPSGTPMPPILSSTNDGLNPHTYFDASAGARKGTIDRALNTADGGYAYRKMIYVVGDVTANLNLADCGTTNTLNVKLSRDMISRMSGRYVIEGGRLVPIKEDMVGRIIKLRSPIFCESPQICRNCYGELLRNVGTPNIGFIAAQQVGSLAEKIMKSFHLGGAVILEKSKIIEELMENVDDELRSNVETKFIQQENDMITKAEFTLVKIDTSIFTNEDKKIVEEEDSYILPVGYFVLMLDDLTLPMSIERETRIFKSHDIELSEGHISITYQKDEKVFWVKPKQEDFSKLARQFDEFVGGKSPWRDVPSLYRKFWKNFSHTENYDSVHLEVIISNILRARKNPKKPARLVKPFDPVMFSIKKLPYIISYPLGLAFENFNQAVYYGMISDRAKESPIEKVLMGIPLVEEK